MLNPLVKRVKRRRSVGARAGVVSCAESAAARHQQAALRLGTLAGRLVESLETIRANSEIAWCVKHEAMMGIQAAREHGLRAPQRDRMVRKQQPKHPYEPKATRPPSGRMPAFEMVIDTPYGPGKPRGGGR